MKTDVIFMIDANDYDNFIGVLETGLEGMKYELKEADPLFVILGTLNHFMSVIKIPVEDNGYTQSSFILQNCFKCIQ